MIIFDTDTVTLLSYGNEKIKSRIDRLPEEEELAVTVVTWMQILQGRYASLQTAANDVELKSAMARFRESEELLGLFRMLPVSDAAAHHFQQLRASKSRKLKAIGRPDLLIACIALGEKALLVTRNIKDFKQVPGLRFENWAD